mmetsp:Transcript_3048/g.6568  ORF Transcript_3048/g.6568 Transcript_3048/m.6568 type:complete len:280 (-) Transcript_3048:69-908(-)
MFIEFPKSCSPHSASLKNPVVVHQVLAGLAGGGAPVFDDGVVEVGVAVRAQSVSCAIWMGHLADLPDIFVFDGFDVGTGFRDLALEQIEQFLVVFHAIKALWKTNTEVDVTIVQMNVTDLTGLGTKLDDVCSGHLFTIYYRVPVSIAQIVYVFISLFGPFLAGVEPVSTGVVIVIVIITANCFSNSNIPSGVRWAQTARLFTLIVHERRVFDAFSIPSPFHTLNYDRVCVETGFPILNLLQCFSLHFCFGCLSDAVWKFRGTRRIRYQQSQNGVFCIEQ